MAVLEIPRAFRYSCDACDEVHLQENAMGHYTNSTPPGWLTLNLVYGARLSDRQTRAPGRLLLCTKCSDEVGKSLCNKLGILSETPTS